MSEFEKRIIAMFLAEKWVLFCAFAQNAGLSQEDCEELYKKLEES